MKLSHNPSYMNFAGADGCPEYREGIFIGYRYYDKKDIDVLFPFGYGLSYTTFEYSDLKVDKTFMTDQETVNVSISVTNTGDRYGKEAIQLYIADHESSVARPEKELKAFKKVSLAPGETKEVTFTLDKRAFAYYEVQLHDFYVESGEFTIMVGSSSKDIRKTAKIHVEGTVEIPVMFTLNSTIGQILKTKKGQAVMAPMMAAMSNQQSDQNLDALGEGSAEMAQAMALEMPLTALVGLAGLPIEQVQGILFALNA
jgi:beta-glucosidase